MKWLGVVLVALAAAAAVFVTLRFLERREARPKTTVEAIARAETLADSAEKKQQRRAAKLLLEAARTADSDAGRTEAFESLATRVDDPHRRDALIEALRDHDPGMRAAAAATLGGLRAERATDALVEALGDEHPAVFTAAMKALQRIHQTRSNILIIAFGESPTIVKKYRAFAVADITDQQVVAAVIEALEDGSPYVRERAFEVIAGVLSLSYPAQPAAKPAVIKGLKDPNGRTRLLAARILRMTPDAEVVRPLAEAAEREEDYNTRYHMLDTLRLVRDPAGIDSLLAALHSSDHKVREAAAWALGHLHHGHAIEGLARYLCRALAHPRNSYIMRSNGFDYYRRDYWEDVDEAIAGIRRLGPAPAVKIFLRALQDPRDEKVRIGAVRALYHIHDETAVGPLITALEDYDARVRQDAAAALGSMREVRAIGPLIEAWSDERADDAELQSKYRVAVRWIAGTDLGPDPSIWRSWWARNRPYFEIETAAEDAGAQVTATVP